LIVESKSNKKATVNLSIDARLLQELRKEASSQNLSLNAKINSVLSKHVYFYRHATQLGCVIWDPKVFLAFLDHMHDEDKIIDIGMKAVYLYYHFSVITTYH
jgi:hypothetical protein